MSGTFDPNAMGQAAVDITRAGANAQQYQANSTIQQGAQQVPAPQQAAPLPPVESVSQQNAPAGDVSPPPTPSSDTSAVPTNAAPGARDQTTLDQNLAQLTKPDQSNPTQGVKTVAQSEETPDADKQAPANTGRPVVDPRPLAVLAEHEPQKYQEVMTIAKEEGIDPARLAAHWKQESNFSYTPDHKQGDGYGPMQVLPGTAQGNNDHGNLDLNNPHDNLRIGAKVIRGLDDTYGRNSVSSVMAYQGGPGSADDIAKNPDAAERNHPNTMNYARNLFAGYNINGKSATPGGTVDPQKLVQTGVQDGPDGLLKYIVQSAPGMNMTDAWQHAEGTLVQGFLMKGDIEGAQHARDFMLQMSHQGSNMHLMQAHQALMNNDSMGAAQHLAAAHAFFPDGTMGRFGIDGKGQLWGQRMDEHDPTKQMGNSFRITPDGVASMLNQTSDPQKYLEMMQKERASSSQARHLDKMGEYYGGLLQNKTDIATQNNATKEDVGASHDAARVQAAEVRNQARTGVGPQAGLVNAANKEATGLYGPDAMPNETPENRANLSELHVGARQMGATGQSAEYIARGLQDRTLQLLRVPSGGGAVVNKAGTTVGYLPQETVERVFGKPLPQSQAEGAGATMGHPGSGSAVNTGPVGAGANSGYAQGSGVTQNLSGTVQPETSAIPPRT